MGRELMAFNEADVVRAIKAMKAADLDVVRTEIHPDGRIVIYHHMEWLPDGYEETFEEWQKRNALEMSANARVYAAVEAEEGRAAQERLRRTLEARKAKHQEASRLRREEKQMIREEAKAAFQKVLTPRSLAAKWQCSERHIRRLVQQGDLKGFFAGGKLLRIREDEADAYEARQCDVQAAMKDGPAIVPDAPKRERLKRLDVGPNARLRPQRPKTRKGD